MDNLSMLETFLHLDTNDALLYTDGYVIFRKDRRTSLDRVKKGGNLLCFVPATMKSVRRYDLEMELHNSEVMCINIKPTRRKSILLVVLYRPPNLNVALTTSLFDSLQQLKKQ